MSEIDRSLWNCGFAGPFRRIQGDCHRRWLHVSRVGPESAQPGRFRPNAARCCPRSALNRPNEGASKMVPQSGLLCVVQVWPDFKATLTDFDKAPAGMNISTDSSGMQAHMSAPIPRGTLNAARRLWRPEHRLRTCACLMPSGDSSGVIMLNKHPPKDYHPQRPRPTPSLVSVIGRIGVSAHRGGADVNFDRPKLSPGTQQCEVWPVSILVRHVASAQSDWAKTTELDLMI